MKKLVDTVVSELNQILLGKDQQVRLALCGLLARGHLLIEDIPGMGKTTLSHALAKVMGLTYQRIQFTNDLLPADVLGYSMYDKQAGSLVFHPGPIFAQVVLADEINRASPRTQSALLEAMEERQVSIEGETRPLPHPFFVIATQNPIEQEGTYPLPEAQLDRFLMHVVIHYPSAEAEKAILQLARNDYRHGLPKTDLRLTPDQVFDARAEVANIYMAEPVEQYLLALVLATRDPAALDPELARWTAFGASPRGTIALDRCARALAWLDGRDYVTPDDVRAMAFDVLRHRILLTFEAEAEGMTADTVIERLIERVPVSA